jgi:hypothetical protein
MATTYAMRPHDAFEVAVELGAPSSNSADEVNKACAMIALFGCKTAFFFVERLTAEVVAVAWALKIGGAKRLGFPNRMVTEIKRFGLWDAVTCLRVEIPDVVVVDSGETDCVEANVKIVLADMSVVQKKKPWRKL